MPSIKIRKSLNAQMTSVDIAEICLRLYDECTVELLDIPAIVHHNDFSGRFFRHPSTIKTFQKANKICRIVVVDGNNPHINPSTRCTFCVLPRRSHYSS